MAGFDITSLGRALAQKTRSEKKMIEEAVLLALVIAIRLDEDMELLPRGYHVVRQNAAGIPLVHPHLAWKDAHSGIECHFTIATLSHQLARRFVLDVADGWLDEVAAMAISMI